MNRNFFSSSPFSSRTASELWELLLAVSDQDATPQSSFMFIFFLKGVLAIYWSKRKQHESDKAAAGTYCNLLLFFSILHTPAIGLTCHCHVPQQHGHYLL